MLVAGFAFTNGSIKLHTGGSGSLLQIYHDKRLAYAKAIPVEVNAMEIYRMAKEILRSETEKGFENGIQLVANTLQVCK